MIAYSTALTYEDGFYRIYVTDPSDCSSGSSTGTCDDCLISPTDYWISYPTGRYAEAIEDLYLLIRQLMILDGSREILKYWKHKIKEKIINLIDRKTMIFRRIMRCNRKGIGLRLKASK